MQALRIRNIGKYDSKQFIDITTRQCVWECVRVCVWMSGCGMCGCVCIYLLCLLMNYFCLHKANDSSDTTPTPILILTATPNMNQNATPSMNHTASFSLNSVLTYSIAKLANSLNLSSMSIWANGKWPDN